MAQYATFAQAYQAMHPEWNPWTPQQKQQLADAYSAKNPTWTPTQDAASVTVNPANFNPYADAGFVLGNAGIQQANTDAQAGFDYGNLRGAQTFGYDANGNPVTFGAGYNPFNQAAELQRSYDNTKRGTTNSYAAQGQLYAGSLKNAQNTNTYNFNRSSDTLQRGASDYFHNLSSSLQATKTAGQQSYAQLVMDALNRYLQTQGG